MARSTRIGPRGRGPRLAALGALLGTLALVPPAAAGGQGKGPAAGTLEVRLNDDSTVKVVVCDERVELETPYGKLSIPVADVRRIDVALRLSEETRRLLDAAAADLGHREYRRREAATARLLALGEKAYPTLLKVARGQDREAARRAEKLVEKIREAVPADHLNPRPFDVVYTEHSKIAGRIKAPSLRVRTLAFGEQRLKLGDVRDLRSLTGDRPGPVVAALADPGNLVGFQAQVGKTFAFRVTAPPAGLGGAVYGTDVYTVDSMLALAAVHAGVLRPGQTGVVRVTVLGQQAGFQGSARNGVVSSAYGAYAGYRVEQPRRGGNGAPR
jgi:hypothetical protein